MRRFVAISLLAVMVVAACGGAGATQAPVGGGGSTATPGGGNSTAAAGASCLDWCGNGSATVTINGTTTTISGGGCLVESGAVDARFGDWWNSATATTALTVLAYQTASTTPTISGKAGGTTFVLGDDAKATVGTDLKGTFSGTNSIGSGTISGTFSCS